MNAPRLTICSAFGPGRPWCVPLWAQSIERLECETPETRFVIFDNTQDAMSSAALIQTAFARKPMHSLVFFHDWTRRTFRDHGSDGLLAFLVTENQRMGDAAADSEIVLWLEPDVEVPEKENGTTALDKMMEVMADPAVGVVGTPIVSQKWGHLMVYDLVSMEPFKVNVGVGVKVPDEPIPTPAGSVSLGLTLIRGPLLRGHTWEPEETCYIRKCHERGMKVMCDWRVRPKHHRTQTEWVGI